MKRFITFTCIAIAGILSMGAQDLQNEQMRATLNTNLIAYHTLCEKLLEHIEAVQSSSASLTEKSKDNKKIKALVKDLNNRISNIYEKTQGLEAKLAELSDSLNTPIPQTVPKEEGNVSPNQPPVKRTRDTRESDGRPPVEGYQDSKVSQQVVHPTPVPANPGDEIERYLSTFSLKQLNSKDLLKAKKSEAVGKLTSLGNTELRDAYVAIFDLLNVQYEIYNRTRVKDCIQRASSIRKDLLPKNHYDELQAEIEHVKEYRYATMELQRLTEIVSNPSSEIRKALGYESSGSGDSKWAESEIIEVPATRIRDYLNNKNETEYIKKFDYTDKKFNEYVEHVDLRPQISKEINEALK